MSMQDWIAADLTAAMRSKDAFRLGVLRMLKSRIMEEEVEQRARKGRDYLLDDPECLAVMSAYAKQRRDSIEAYREGGREDLATREEAELAIVQEYLPARLSEEDVRRIVAEAIAESGAKSAKEMG